MSRTWDYASLEDEQKQSRANRTRNRMKDIVILGCSVVICILLYLVAQRRPTLQTAISDYTGIDSSTERWKLYHWWTGYSSGANDTDVDIAWSSMRPAHGIVALDYTWAMQKKLPATMRLPSDQSKGVYIIDAYHQLHCLTIIRKTMLELGNGMQPTYPVGHSKHCFDALRQYIMCTAGDTPLYTWGKNVTGDGQLRRCRDWTALSQWAADHSACYRDTEKPVPLDEHFGHCEDLEMSSA